MMLVACPLGRDRSGRRLARWPRTLVPKPANEWCAHRAARIRTSAKRGQIGGPQVSVVYVVSKRAIARPAEPS